MLKYIIKRSLWTIPTLIGVLVLLFSLTYFLPGDPATAMLGPRATPALVEALNNRLHLDRPLPIRLGYYLMGVVKGDLGTSVWSGHKVSELILENLPHTILLAFCSLGLLLYAAFFWACLLPSIKKQTGYRCGHIIPGGGLHS